MKKIIFLSIALLIYTLNLTAQKEGLASIDKSDLKAYMTFFASDEMKGRETGSITNEVAALYLKTNIMRLGLKTIPETGDYFQQVPLAVYEIKEKETYLRINDKDSKPIFTTDSLIYLMSPFKTMDTTGNFVFAGYGFTDTVKGYDDLKDVDLKDKIVLLMTGSPGYESSDDFSSVFDIKIEEPKLMSIFRRGAKAILYVYDPKNAFQDAYASGLAEMGTGRVGTKNFSLGHSEESTPIQVAFITRHAADMLLQTSGHTLQQMQQRIITEGKPVSYESNENTVTFRTCIENSNQVSSNVIGIVEGSDPVLKEECVIYTAHFDHVGVNNNGEVFNGADDNASGSMALLEIAQAFMNLKKKPKRSIVFAWVNGEEKGLLGSKYYTENPVISMEKTMLDINLDMVGRSKMASDTGKFMGYEITISNPGEILIYTDQTGKKFLDIVSSTSQAAGIRAINMGKDPKIGSSDYASFMEKGVPAIFFNSGEYPDLHTIRDDVEKIDFDKMEKVSKMAFLIGYSYANQKDGLNTIE